MNPYEIIDELNSLPKEDWNTRRTRMARAIATFEAIDMDREMLVESYIDNRTRSIDEYDKQSDIERRYNFVLTRTK